jgi:hypothetical protein
LVEPFPERNSTKSSWVKTGCVAKKSGSFISEPKLDITSQNL